MRNIFICVVSMIFTVNAVGAQGVNLPQDIQIRQAYKKIDIDPYERNVITDYIGLPFIGLVSLGWAVALLVIYAGTLSFYTDVVDMDTIGRAFNSAFAAFTQDYEYFRRLGTHNPDQIKQQVEKNDRINQFSHTLYGILRKKRNKIWLYIQTAKGHVLTLNREQERSSFIRKLAEEVRKECLEHNDSLRYFFGRRVYDQRRFLGEIIDSVVTHFSSLGALPTQKAFLQTMRATLGYNISWSQARGYEIFNNIAEMFRKYSLLDRLTSDQRRNILSVCNKLAEFPLVFAKKKGDSIQIWLIAAGDDRNKDRFAVISLNTLNRDVLSFYTPEQKQYT